MEIGLAEREGHQSDLVSGVKGGRVEVGGGEEEEEEEEEEAPPISAFQLEREMSIV